MMFMYTKPNCKNCEILKQSLDSSGIEYEVKSYCNIPEEIMEKGLVKSFPILENPKENGKVYNFQEAMDTFDEPLLNKSIQRFSFYPIKYPDMYEMYKKSRASYWQPEEISLAKDHQDWKSLNNDEKHFISYILAFFATSDGIVNENININFANEIQVPEARAFYTFQEAIESVHSETYSILLDSFVSDPLQKKFLQEGISTIPAIKAKAQWAFKFMNSSLPFAKRLVAFACIEGIYFSGSFCAIYWLKKRNLLHGLTFSNELISRDEGLHTEFAVLLYSYVKNKLSQSEINTIVSEAVINEKQFIIESLPCRLIGMNSELMSQYIEFVADRLITSLGYNKIYYTQNPFDFMENISLNGKTNFFEKRVGEYAKAGVMNNAQDNTFSLEEDF